MRQTLDTTIESGSRAYSAKLQENLFEDAAFDYENARTKILAAVPPVSTSSQAQTTRILTTYLRKEMEQQALQYLREIEATGDVAKVQDDAIFAEYARAQLDSTRSDRFACFLTWFAFAPRMTPAMESREARKNWRHIQRSFLMHPNQPMQVLKEFAILAANKGLALWSHAVFDHLSRILPLDELEGFWQHARSVTLEPLKPDLDARKNPESRIAYRHKRQQLDMQHGTMILERAASGVIHEAALWLLRSIDPSQGFDRVHLVQRGVFTSILRSLDKCISAGPAQEAHVSKQLRTKVWQQFKAMYAKPAENFSLQQLAYPNNQSPTEFGRITSGNNSDGIGMKLVRSFPSLRAARDAIRSVGAATGLELISANTLAGYIARLEAEHHDYKHAWEHLGLDVLVPSPYSDVCRARWTAAYMQFYHKTRRPLEAMRYYFSHCIPLGLPPALVTFAAQDALHGVEQYQYEPHYATAAVNDILLRSYLSSQCSSDALVLELYSDFLSSPNLHQSNQAFQPFLEAFSASAALQRDCLRIAHDMKSIGLEPDVVNWTTVLGALASIPDAQLTFNLLRRMEGNPNTEPLVQDVSEADQLGDLDVFLEAPHSAEYEHFSLDAFNLPKPNIVTYTAVMRGFAKAQLPGLSRRVLTDLQNNLPADEVEWHMSSHTQLSRVIKFVKATEKLLSKSVSR